MSVQRIHHQREHVLGMVEEDTGRNLDGIWLERFDETSERLRKNVRRFMKRCSADYHFCTASK